MTAADASVISTMICDMLSDRSFHRAYESFGKFRHMLVGNDVWRIMFGIATSYDHVQYNQTDELQSGRYHFVEFVANVVASMDSADEFVHPLVAVAFAFHPGTRRIYIEKIAKTDGFNFDKLFAPKRATEVCAMFDEVFVPSENGLVGKLSLRDIYWGRDFDTHVDIFLQNQHAPFVASWHGAAEMLLRHHSLEYAVPQVPFLSTICRIVERKKLQLDRVSVCGNLLDDDPACRCKTVTIRDAVVAAQALQFRMGLRVCFHFECGAKRDGPVTETEIWIEIYNIVWGMSRLTSAALTPYVKLGIIEWCVPHIPNRRRVMQYIENLATSLSKIIATRNNTKKIKK